MEEECSNAELAVFFSLSRVPEMSLEEDVLFYSAKIHQSIGLLNLLLPKSCIFLELTLAV